MHTFGKRLSVHNALNTVHAIRNLPSALALRPHRRLPDQLRGLQVLSDEAQIFLEACIQVCVAAVQFYDLHAYDAAVQVQQAAQGCIDILASCSAIWEALVFCVTTAITGSAAAAAAAASGPDTQQGHELSSKQSVCFEAGKLQTTRACLLAQPKTEPLPRGSKAVQAFACLILHIITIDNHG